MNKRKAGLAALLTLTLLASGCTTAQNQTTEPNFKYIYTTETGNNIERTAEIARDRLSKAGIQAQINTYVEQNETRPEGFIIYTEKTSQRLRELMKLRKFRAALNITASNSLKLKENHSIQVKNDSITLDGEDLHTRNTTQVEETEIRLAKIREGTAHLIVEAYDAEDVRSVNDNEMKITARAGSYSYRFPVILSNQAANRVLNLAQNLQKGERYLKHGNGEQAKMYLYQGNTTVNSLTISNGFQREPVKKVSISGTADTRKKALEKAQNLMATIASGRFPEKPVLQKIGKVNATRR